MKDWRTLLRVLTVSLLVLTLDADSQDCFLQIKVRRHTVYEASVGQELRINCTVAFCNSSPPTVTWYKVEEMFVPVNLSSNIKTEWKLLEEFEGVSYLIFQNIHKGDAGVYQCQTEGTVSHSIKISVYDGVFNGTIQKNTTDGVPSVTLEEDAHDYTSLDYAGEVSPAAVASPYPFVFRVVGIIVFIFAMIMIIVCVTLKPNCKGTQARTAASRQSSYSQQDIPIYENDL